MFLALLPYVFIVMGDRASTAAVVAAFEHSDLLFDELSVVLTFGCGNRILQSVVLDAPRGHVRGGWTIVVAGLSVEALALVAQMVDALVPAAFLELRVDQGSPLLPCVLHPLAVVEAAALWCAVARWIATVRAAKPGLPRAVDSVVLALRDHQVCMGVVDATIPVGSTSPFGLRQ